MNIKRLQDHVNTSDIAVSIDKEGQRVILSSPREFKGMSLKKQDIITRFVNDATIQDMKSSGVDVKTHTQVREQSKKDMMPIITSVSAKSLPLDKQVMDAVFNTKTSVGTFSDMSVYSRVSPNIWMSPYEANALYSQKGLMQTVINKKSKSILTNGVKIRNSRLTQKQLETIEERMEMLNVPLMISNAVRDSLVYGGAIIFPMFNGDMPFTMNMSMQELFDFGILKKDSIERFVSLDRWNCFIVPPVNPTSKNFLDPDFYIVPFLGSTVNKGRTTRIVSSPQAGYWGSIMTQGWGISDFSGYVREYENYKIAVNTIPTMIQQMSILARTMDVSGIIAQEGINILDSLQKIQQMEMREASVNNPISMDVLGDLKSIDRDFSDVNNLIHMLREDFGAACEIPEPLLWSSQKASFSSGEDTGGNFEKQSEAMRYLHKDISIQFKRLAKILVIDALGTDHEVLQALPYTTIHFDTPTVANPEIKAQIGNELSQTAFNYSSSGMPLDIAYKLAAEIGGSEMQVSSEIVEELEKVQKEKDRKADEKHELEMDLLEEQIKASGIKASEGSSAAPKLKSSSKDKDSKLKGSGYKPGYSKAEQKEKQRTRGTDKRAEVLKKNQNKAS